MQKHFSFICHFEKSFILILGKKWQKKTCSSGSVGQNIYIQAKRSVLQLSLSAAFPSLWHYKFIKLCLPSAAVMPGSGGHLYAALPN